MVHVLTEDTKSGFYIWELIRQFSIDVQVFCFSGNQELRKALANIIANKEVTDAQGKKLILAKEDSFVISCDRFDQDTYRKLKASCRSLYPRDYIVSTYGCVESVILSSELLFQWVRENVYAKKNAEAAIFLHNQILSKNDKFFGKFEEYECPELIRQLFYGSNNTNGCNAETLVYSILSQYTHQSGFDVTKQQLGICWCDDCHMAGTDPLCKRREVLRQYRQDCQNRIPDQYLKAKDRMFELITHSQFNNGFENQYGSCRGLLDLVEWRVF